MTKKLLMIIKITMLISALFFASCSSSSDTATPSGGDTSGSDTSGSDTSGNDTSGSDTSGGDTSGGDTSGGDTSGGDTSGGDTSGGDTAIGEVIGTAEGKVLFRKSGSPELGNVYRNVSNMTCTLEVEEAGKSPTTYNGICSKNDLDTTISFHDKAVDPSISARLLSHAGKIEYIIKGEAISAIPGTTTTVSRNNNVWEGKITTADGGTDLLKLIIKTQDKVVTAPADSKPCQFVGREVVIGLLANYTLDGNCVLVRDANDAVTKLDFTSSLSNPPVTISLPVGNIPITEDNQSLFKDAYRIGGYFHINVDYVVQEPGSYINVNNKNSNDNEFKATFVWISYTLSTDKLLEFDIVLTE